MSMVSRLIQLALAFLSIFLFVLAASPVHAAAPAVVTTVVPTPGDRAVTLTWTNPASVDFTGTMVRYSTSAFPTNTSDGTLAGDIAGSPSGTSTTTVNGLTNGTTYYFSLFSHNVTPEYSAAVNAQQVAMAPVFTDDFEALSLANIHGQNGWTALGGTWTVMDTAGEQWVRSSTDNTIPAETNRLLNGGTVSTYSNQMLRVDWKAGHTNFPGQLFLRAQSADADAGGYYLWHSSGTLRLSYKTTSGATTTALTTAAFALSTNTWYTYEFSVVNDAAGLPVLTVYAWQRGAAKPSTPTIQFTDTIPRFSQGVFSIGKSGAAATDYDNVAWYGMPGISGVTATPGDSNIVLSWTNPTYATYTGTMVRFSTSSFPASTTDGTLVSSVTGTSAGTSSLTHTGRTNGTTYYYALFPYDASGVYGTPMYIRQVAYPALFSENFESRTLGDIVGQNGWISSGGTWTVTDLSSNRVLLGSSAVDGYQSNKAQNGSDQTTDQVLIAKFLSDNSSNLAGQFWLRQQSTAGQGYNFWHSNSVWNISYVDTTQGINTPLATSAASAGPPMEANVWYNVEASAIDDGSDLPVLTLFVWKDGAEKPATPTLQVTDPVNHYPTGFFSLGKASSAPYGYYDNVAQYGSAPALTVTSPAAAVGGAPNVATIAIVDGGGTMYVPYIQTSTTLSAAASATGVPTGGGVQFVLNEGIAGEQTVTDLTAPYTASFSGLAKAEYTLDVYVLQGDGTTRFSAADSHVERTDIGIGDIITVIGDSVTEGSNGGINSTSPVTSWLDADADKISADNRQFPQHGANTGVYNESYLTDLNDRLAAYYDYPVFLMNEGVAGIRANNYSSVMAQAAWQSRQTALVPNKWIISLGVNDAWNDYTAEQTVTALTSIINTLTSSYGATANAIYLTTPNYDFRNSVNAVVPVSTYLSAYGAAYTSLRSALGLQGGANFYDVYENYRATEYQNLVHPNATGYIRMARLMALAFMKPTLTSVSADSARQVTVNWSSLAAEEPTVAGYRVNYGKSESTMTSSAVFGDVTTGAIGGLEPGMTYYFSVQAIDNDPYDVSYSDESSILSATTSARSGQTTVTSSTGSSSSSAATPTITLLSPNGGETLAPGSRQEVSWQTTGSGLSTVTLSYSIDGGTSYATIATVANLGFTTWTVPNVDADSVILLLQAGDLSSTLAQDTSDAAFAIRGTSSAADDDDVASGDADDDSVTTPAVVIVPQGTGTSPYTGAPEEVTEVATGDYIRSPNYATVYYVDADGKRRPFMDAQTFFTYEDSFAVVKTVTDATLPQLTLGAPMSPKAGTVLVKIISDPRVYWVSEVDGVATLQWIVSESVAQGMLGSSWADYVIDIPPTMIGRYVRGSDLTEPLTLSASGGLRTRMMLTAMALPR